MSSEGGAIRAAAAAAATSALAAAIAASRCKESCARERAMARSRGQTCYERRKDLGGRERGWRGGVRETYLGRAKERPRTSSEASQRRQDRRRQPAITSWNVWERVGLDPKGPTTTKFSPLPPFLLPHQRLLRKAPTLYRMTPGKRRAGTTCRSCGDLATITSHT